MANSEEATLDNQKSILDNQNSILKNQETIISNQETLLKNQDDIKSNQEVIVGNQSSIIDNQKQIVDNQALLGALSKTQAYILNAVRKNGGASESIEETQKFIDNLKSEVKSDTKTDLAKPESI